MNSELSLLATTPSNNVPGVSLIKSVAPVTTAVGGTVTYTLTLSNQSARTLTNITVRDNSISPSLSVSSLLVNGSAPAPGESLATGLTVPDLVTGGLNTIVFTATVLEGAPASLPNTASATFSGDAGSTFDTILSNSAFLAVEQPQPSPDCLCQSVTQAVQLCCASSILGVDVNYNGIRELNLRGLRIFKVNYSIVIHYISTCGCIKHCYADGSVLFWNPATPLIESEPGVFFRNVSLSQEYNRVVVCFDAMICPPVAQA